MDVARLAQRGSELCHALADGQDVVPEVLELLARGVGTDMVSWSCIRFDGAGTTLQQHGRGPLDEHGVAAWERLLPSHPYAVHLLTDPAPRPRLTDLVDLATFERTEVYEVCLRPHGDRYQAGFVLDRAPDRLTLFALWRAGRDFTDEEVAPVQLLAAALAASLRVRDNLTALGALAQDGCPPARSLTPRQAEVVALVAQGLTNDQIAHRLGLSARTVRKHLEVLFARTGVRSRTGLAVAWRDSVRGRSSPLAL